MTPPPESHEGGRGLRDQIERYRTAFTAVIVMIVIAALSGGYILTHERISLPSWVPVLGHSYFTLNAEFQTGQAIAPGQGQSVTIAGAKIGEIASVRLRNGRAFVTMNITPKYARYIYRDATMLMRPKTQLQDIAIEIEPGDPASGRMPAGTTVSISQTAPNVDLDQFLASLDADTRAYLQELVVGAGQGLKGNARNLSATFKRFDPFARDLQEIGRAVSVQHSAVALSIHNFRLLLQALGGKDNELAELVDSANAALGTFAKEDRAVQQTVRELPPALHETTTSLGELASAARVVGPTLVKLQPFAREFAPAERQAQAFLRKTTPILKNEVRPFTREIAPVVAEIQPDTQDLAEAFPGLSSAFKTLNELLNELAYNPGPNEAGFLFYLSWFGHNVNSVLSSSDANGPIGHGLLYFACKQLFTIPGAAEVNPTLRAVIGLLHPPAASKTSECPAPSGGGITSASELSGRVFGKGLDSTFGFEGNP